MLLNSAVKDMVIPLATPVRGRDGTIVDQLVVSRGTEMILHYQAANTAPELWGDDAHEWKPERWLAPLPKAVEDARIPGVYSNLCVVRRVRVLLLFLCRARTHRYCDLSIA